ncbi:MULTISPECIES: hypothetical protein [Rhodococcus]|uniref:hypothetical protein n=1 Tax=Rhodococcus TaxID=1827 RepID=UPI001386C64B|nr:hypothetical protein [Rhodococcus aetherivorans]NCL73170.1 hypothetical protein [Rhodococcus sp. YH1]WFS11158.1 hypothetical protein P9K37_15135 [Rhodococcus aetherivorans]
MTTTPEPAEAPVTHSGRLIDARLHLLDRQILDCNEVPVATVDDIELAGMEFGSALDPAAPPRIDAILTGSTLATRIFGGRPPRARLQRIHWSDVLTVGVTVGLRVRSESLDATWTERWVRDHIIGHIPGGRHAPE